MEAILSDFISRTNTDPSFAQDLLEATGWNIESALAAFDGLNVTHHDIKYDDPVINLSGYNEEIDMPSIKETNGTSALTENGGIKKRSKRRKGKGLALVADEIGETFLRVAVSSTKLVAGADKKEQVFDEQFFKHSFLYPDFTKESDDLQKFIASDITEKSHKYTLEKSGHLNWWASTGKLPCLEPLATSGDGNCLLHATSLYMWGLPDQNLILRTHLHRLLTQSAESERIHRRWRYSTNLRNQEAGGLTFSEEEWEFEWQEIIRISTNKPRRRPTTDSLRRYSTLRVHYESLEEIHVFALAHVIRRPIVVLSDEFLRDMSGEPLAPIYFSGIYLPLEISPSFCYKSPLILAYDSSHFSPLVAKRDPDVAEKQRSTSRFRHLKSKQDTVMPLVTPAGSLLPFPFIYDPKSSNFPEKWATEKFTPGEFPDEIRTLLESYLDIRWIQLDIGSKFGNHNEYTEEGSLKIPVKIPKVRFPAAVVSNIGEPEYQCQLVARYLEDVKARFDEEKKRQEKAAAEIAKQEEELRKLEANRPVPCQGKDCTMYGKKSTNNLCSMCYTKYTKKGEEPEDDGSIPTTSRVPPNSPSRSVVPPELIPRQMRGSPQRESNDGKWDIILPDISTTTMDIATGTDTPRPTPTSSGSKSQSHGPSEEKVPQVPPKKRSLFVKPMKPPPPSTGYQRDRIKPGTVGGRPYCVTPGCDYRGSSQTGGYCSQCHNASSQQKVTDV